ncbi:hypothetical protein SJDPG4_10140 [Porphyromonas gingivalis SJD4]|nr:hypothetical protein SJDPG4_10140 [Porphyromonas gingivalis SJD4]
MFDCFPEIKHTCNKFKTNGVYINKITAKASAHQYQLKKKRLTRNKGKLDILS